MANIVVVRQHKLTQSAAVSRPFKRRQTSALAIRGGWHQMNCIRRFRAVEQVCCSCCCGYCGGGGCCRLRI